MNALKPRVLRSPRFLASAAAVCLCVLSSCNSNDILKVTDPDLINPEGLQTVTGATPLRYGVIRNFVDAFDGGVDAFVIVTGNMADELRASDTFDGRLLPNQRQANDILPELNGVYLNLHKARAGATYAIKVLQDVQPNIKFNIGELYMYRAYTEDFFGEMYCSGVPFSETDGANVTYGDPQTTAQIFTRSAASFDTARANADTSRRVLYGAQIGQGRALLNLGQYAQAAAAVNGVPTTFRLTSDHCIGSGCTENGVWNAAVAPSSRYTPANREGVNGLEFLPAIADPRLPWRPSSPPRTGFAASWTNLPDVLKPTRNGPTVIADGIEARLIEAEARLNQGDTQADRAAVFALLNNLRATAITGLAPIPGSAPTTKAAAVSQLFAERAYWMYLTGRRLGDMRRLIRQYGRDPETVFPTGSQDAPVTGTYGTDVNFPVPASEKNNPKFTGCLDRKA